VVLSTVLAAPRLKDPPSLWRADPPPAGLQAELMNEGLPYRWEPGTIHILAWATIADDYRQSETTQALVIKQFDWQTKRGGHRWVLAVLYHDAKKPNQPWYHTEWHYAPVFPGEQWIPPPDAEAYGYEFYLDRPTDEQVSVFLREASWDFELGTTDLLLSNATNVQNTRTLIAGSVDPIAWRQVFEREVPPNLFVELRRP
jgi:hypothetical protein